MSHCTECDTRMDDAEARCYEACRACRNKGRSAKLARVKTSVRTLYGGSIRNQVEKAEEFYCSRFDPLDGSGRRTRDRAYGP